MAVFVVLWFLLFCGVFYVVLFVFVGCCVWLGGVCFGVVGFCLLFSLLVFVFFWASCWGIGVGVFGVFLFGVGGVGRFGACRVLFGVRSGVVVCVGLFGWCGVSWFVLFALLFLFLSCIMWGFFILWVDGGVFFFWLLGCCVCICGVSGSFVGLFCVVCGCFRGVFVHVWSGVGVCVCLGLGVVLLCGGGCGCVFLRFCLRFVSFLLGYFSWSWGCVGCYVCGCAVVWIFHGFFFLIWMLLGCGFGVDAVMVLFWWVDVAWVSFGVGCG